MQYPDCEDVDYEIIGGMVVMQLADNHIPLLSKTVPYLVNYIKTENKIDPKLVITHVLPGSQVQQVRALAPGFVLSEVNGVVVETLEQFRDALHRSVETGYLTMKTDDDVFVVLAIEEVLADEDRLSHDFVYPMSEIVQELRKKLGILD